jgi:hypothetical protein
MMKKLVVLVLMVAGAVLPAVAQQEWVNRWDVFAGYSYLDTHTIGLRQNGADGSFGVNVFRWLGLGTDFSWFHGSGDLATSNTTLPGQIAETIAATPCTPPLCFAPEEVLPLFEKTYAPISASTFTWAAGPQINFRNFSRITIFVRPGFGLIHESVDVNQTSVNEQLTSLCASSLQAGLFCTSPQGAAVFALLNAKLQPHMVDTVPFYGAGAGFDVNASKRIGVRFSADYVRHQLFSSVLGWQNSIRISVGPTFRFGEIGKSK